MILTKKKEGKKENPVICQFKNAYFNQYDRHAEKKKYIIIFSHIQKNVFSPYTHTHTHIYTINKLCICIHTHTHTNTRRNNHIHSYGRKLECSHKSIIQQSKIHGRKIKLNQQRICIIFRCSQKVIIYYAIEEILINSPSRNYTDHIQLSSVQWLSCVRLFATP